jgi:hypothetical protein
VPWGLVLTVALMILVPLVLISLVWGQTPGALPLVLGGVFLFSFGSRRGRVRDR